MGIRNRRQRETAWWGCVGLGWVAKFGHAEIGGDYIPFHIQTEFDAQRHDGLAGRVGVWLM